ncbi:transporter substrate-binding domain-containing protein [Shewanella psychropiezotolerans]|uniref:Transporter substrate-binding domain-containing protein n=1 Tax=Shewanella psychropiezotolerans TaxID=2593655 RepID=A0ABX5X2R5_9GAMM|nr:MULTISPECIES: transporter substrate-binding domain-containing protein [Shewanella]MPY23578.1 transporter substrate-binding domain-containing protein [Shewanella sp. YLB-07]QDO85639.1 transporter substrate-binding domain-containing protein [Shewanella psychropiezotolerans]
MAKMFCIASTFLLSVLILLACVIAIPLEAKPDKLKIVSNEYPPFYSKLSPEFGVVSHLTREALQRANLAFTHDFFPFSRAVLLTKGGYADGIIGIWYRESRVTWVEYSEPMLSVNVVLYKRVQHDISYTQLSDLSDFTIGVGRGYANPQAFMEAGLKTEEGSSDGENLKKLLLGRTDLVLISQEVAEYLMTEGPKEYDHAFEVIGDPLSIELFHFGISKTRGDHKDLIVRFNQGLNEMKLDGSVQRILKQHGFEANAYWLQELQQELKEVPRN